MAADVKKGLVSEAAATTVYGVVLDVTETDVTVKQQATDDRRKDLREKRLENSSVPAQED